MPPFIIEENTIRWPQELLCRELLREVENLLDGWEKRCETILRDAFTTPALANSFERLLPTSPFAEMFEENSTKAAIQFLEDIAAHSEDFPTYMGPKILFSKRKEPKNREPFLTVPETIDSFERVVRDLRERGYLNELFGDSCPDSVDMELSPQEVLADRYSVSRIWPIESTTRAGQNLAPFLDLIEALDDLVRAPIVRSWHSFGEPHWDNSETSRWRGQEIYRWEVNRVLEKSELPYVIVSHGADAGYVAERFEADFADLANELMEIDNDGLKNRIDIAIALFRNRSGGRESKNSACVKLAGILEERGKILKENLDKPDERDLFKIANNFALRHRRDNQKDDYAPEFLDWIFWTYMATISLTEKLIKRDSPTS